MTTEAAVMKNNMGIVEKVVGGYGWRKIEAVETQDNRGIGDGDT